MLLVHAIVVPGAKQLLHVNEHDRRIIRNTDRHAQNQQLFALILLRIMDELRPRPDQTHLSLEYVEQLRKLVEFVSPQEPTYPGYARVILPYHQPAHTICADNHAAKLNHT